MTRAAGRDGRAFATQGGCPGLTNSLLYRVLIAYLRRVIRNRSLAPRTYREAPAASIADAGTTTARARACGPRSRSRTRRVGAAT